MATPLHHSLLTWLLYALYPAWLLAGLFDYLCHRRTQIENTSGAIESGMHVLQFAILGSALAGAVLFKVSTLSFILVAAALVAHTVLGYIDVRYTDGRRRILPFEQMAHGFLEVLPLVAGSLFGFIYWPTIRGNDWSLQINSPVSTEIWMLLVSYLAITGAPVLEEWRRTWRSQRRAVADLP